MTDVLSFGEILIDFTPTRSNNITHYMENPGGAPANVACGLAKLGMKSGFMGQAGNDHFGYFLKNTLDEHHVDTRGLVLSKLYPTTLAFVHLDKNGERSFSFYRQKTADVMISVDDINPDLIRETRILHFGSLSLTTEPAITTTRFVLEEACSHNRIISYDPNYRPRLWENEEEAVKAIRSVLEFTDIIKVSEEELLLITGESDIKKGCALLHCQGPSLVLVTLGSKGACISLRGNIIEVPSIRVNVTDTTGAGDAFTAGFLYKMLREDFSGIDNLNSVILKEAGLFANICGALTCRNPGAIPAMPDLKTVREILVNKK